MVIATAEGLRVPMILIVEDEIFIRQNADWLMQDLGHHTLVASDLSEALAQLLSDSRIDALFVDIRLREMALGGYDIANHAVAGRPEIRVLYTSGTPLCPEMTDRFVAGGQFLEKPYSPEQLVASMERLLA